MKSLLIFFLSVTALTPKPSSIEAVLQKGSQVQTELNLQEAKIYTDPAFTPLLEVWQDFLSKGVVKPYFYKTVKKADADIIFEQKDGMQAEEYGIRMDKKRVTVLASSCQGAWWAMQSLTQMAINAYTGESRTIQIPAVIVRDCPAFSYRGAHLDCCRHFFTVSEVKRFIDLMCLHKLNTFHWHLTDDQGWRIEIEKYPLLTRIGSVRKQTLVGHSHDRPAVYDGKPYGEGMFYTQEEIRDIVKYAADRQITVIPEIEMPGHMVSALAAYPYLGCTGGPYEVWQKWGISDDVLCLGKDSSYEFIFDVLDEVCALFPSKYIHIGGDEAPVVKRKSCEHCQARMKELGLTSEVQLQGLLIAKVEEYLKAKGREIIGWNEILETGISRDAIVMSWQGTGKSGIVAAQRGNRVIMTPGKFLYFDYYQTEDHEKNDEPLAIGGCLPLEKVYSFDPYASLTGQQRGCILGIQANTWSEYISTFAHVQHMVLPRMAALSEICWSTEKDEYPDFLQRVKDMMLPLYDHFGYIWAPYEFK